MGTQEFQARLLAAASTSLAPDGMMGTRHADMRDFVIRPHPDGSLGIDVDNDNIIVANTSQQIELRAGYRIVAVDGQAVRDKHVSEVLAPNVTSYTFTVVPTDIEKQDSLEPVQRLDGPAAVDDRGHGLLGAIVCTDTGLYRPQGHCGRGTLGSSHRALQWGGIPCRASRTGLLPSEEQPGKCRCHLPYRGGPLGEGHPTAASEGEGGLAKLRHTLTRCPCPHPCHAAGA